MKVFISWSGDRSRKLAEFLAGWLKKFPLTIEPWVSKEAIDPGTRWGKELADALEGTSFGILCITPENQKEPWISFEAGALSKTIEKTYVVPYLIGMTPIELEQPLKQFQAIEANEQDTWKLIETIHMASGDKTRTKSDLEEAYKMWWPKLIEKIDNTREEALETGTIKQEPNLSEIKNGLDKVLIILESLSSRLSKSESYYPTINEIIKNQLIDSMTSKKEVRNYLRDIIISQAEKKENVSDSELFLKKLWENINVKDKIDKISEE